MRDQLILTLVKGWLLIFIPLGLLGVALWALWRLIPHLRRTMGYKHPYSK